MKVAQKFGKYEIIAELGRGGLGVVYKARDPLIGRLVALKALAPEVLADPDLLMRFYREAQAAANLQHANVVTIYDLGEISGSPYIAMELVEGDTLRKIIDRKTPIPLAQKLSIIRQFCAGLAHAHQHGVIHRDVRPENILVMTDGTAVVDFGIARLESSSMTRAGLSIGAVQYSSPEQINKGTLDARSDIFAAGVVIYEFLTYRRPFEGPTMAAIIEEVMKKDPAPLRQQVLDIPAELETIVGRCLRKDPDARYQKLDEMLSDLGPIAQSLQQNLAEHLMGQVPDLIARGEFTRARDVLLNVMTLDRGHSAAKSLLAEVNAEIKRSEVSTKITDCVNRGQASLQAGDYQSAVKSAEEALKIDPNHEPARSLLAVARREMERNAEEQKRLVASQNAYLSGNSADAEISLKRVLELAPNNPDALALLQQIRNDRGEKEKRLWLQEGLWQARNLLQQSFFEEASQKLTQLRGAFPAEAEIPQLLAEANQKSEALRNEVEGVRVCLAENRLQEAFQRAGNLASTYPTRADLAQLFEVARGQFQSGESRRELEAGLAKIRTLIKDRVYAVAIERCDMLQRRYPDNTEIRQLRAQAESEKKATEAQRPILEAAKPIQTLLNAGKYDAAAAQAEQALARFPGNAELGQLLVMAHQGKRMAQVSIIKALIEGGSFEQAIRQGQSALEQYPGDAELENLIKTASEQRDRKEEPDSFRATEIFRVENLPPAATQESVLPPPPFAPPVPPEHLNVATPSEPVSIPAPPEPVAPLFPPEPIAPVISPAPMSVGVPPPIAAPEAMPQPTVAPVPPPVLEPPPPGQVTRGSGKKTLLLVAVVSVVFLIVLAAAAGVLYFVVKKKGLKRVPPPAQLVQFEILTTPSGASVSIDGKMMGNAPLKQDMAAGDHQLEAMLPGYQSAQRTMTLVAGTPASVSLELQPLSSSLHIFTDLESGDVQMEGQPSAKLQDGQFALDPLEPGKHSMRVTSKGQTATLDFEAAPATAPNVTAATASQNLSVIAVGSLGGHARIVSSIKALQVGVDGQTLQPVGPDGLTLDNLAPGSHELTFAEGQEQQKKTMEMGAAPALTVYLSSNRNVGTLVVLSDADGARVTLDGKLQRRPTKNGQLRVMNLEPKQYVVEVSKDGYEKAASQTAQVRKGEETKLTFTLKPVARMAALSVQGATPEAEVLLDGKSVGTVGGDGALSASNIAPGEHAVELRKSGFQPKQVRVQFVAGKTETVKLSLEQASGTLLINVSPPVQELTLRHQGESSGTSISAGRRDIPAGNYTLTARWSSGREMSKPVQIVAGETLPVNLNLTGMGMEGWQNPKEWVAQGKWYVHQGSGTSLYSASPTAGTFVFTAQLRKGERLAWVLNYTDPSNYLLFEIDARTISRKEVVGGQEKDLSTSPSEIGKSEYCSVRIDVTRGSIVHQIYNGKQLVPVDTWKDSSRDFSRGKFGFLIAPRQKLEISNFSFSPQ